MPTLSEIRQQYPQYSDMDDGALAGALHQKFYSDMPREEFNTKIGYAAAQPKPDQTTWYERAGRGLRDVVEGAGQLGAHSLAMPFILNREKVAALPGKVDAEINQSQADYTAKRGENAGNFDPLRMAGNVAGTLPLAAIPGGASLLGGVGVGAGTAMLEPVVGEEAQANYGAEKAKQGAIGGVMGGGMNLLARGLGKIVSPSVDPAVKELMDKGVTPTPGQLLGGVAKRAEDLTGMGQKGVTAEFNIAAVNDALEPLGVKLPKGIAAGQQAIAEANNIVKSAYDNTWTAARPVALDKTAVTEIDGILTEAAKKLKPDQLGQFQALMQDALSSVQGAGTMTADKMRAGIDALRQHADDFMAAGGGDRIMGRMFTKLGDGLEDAAIRSNPELAAAKAAADKAYAGMVRINSAAAKDVGEGIFTPRQLAAAVKSGAGNKTTAQGDALLQPIASAGMKVLGGAGNSASTLLPYGLGAAGMGASYVTSDPQYAALGMGAAGLYTPTGRRMLAAAMTKRPDSAKAIADAIRAIGPYMAGASGAAAGMPHGAPPRQGIAPIDVERLNALRQIGAANAAPVR